MAASAVMTFSGYTDVNAKIIDLSYGANTYDRFKFIVYKWDGSDWDLEDEYLAYGYEYGSQDWADYNFLGLEPNTYYYVEIFAKYSGTWYPSDPSVGTGYESANAQSDPIPDATFSNSSITKTTIQFDYTNTVGAMNLYFWNGSSWVGIASSGMPYSVSSITNGHRIILSTLVPNYNYYFKVRTIVGSYYSETGNQLYTTSAWPTISTGITLSYRVDGNLYLNWGDNGYEEDDFIYGLTIDSVGYYLRYGHSNQSAGLNDYSIQHTFKVLVAIYGYSALGTNGLRVDTAGETSEVSIYTAPHYPTGITLNSRTDTTISVTATGMTGLYSAVEWRWRVSGSGTGYNTSIDYGGGLSKTIESLLQETEYEIQCYGYYTTSSLYSVGKYTRYITTLRTRPSNWSWTSDISSGADLTVSGKTIYIMPASEWNDFLDRIDDFRYYNYLSDYPFTAVTSESEFYYTTFNQARTAIDNMSPPTAVPTAVSSGHEITAAKLNGLKDSLNSIL